MRKAGPILCCRRVGAVPAAGLVRAYGAHSRATASFLRRPGWNVFRDVLAGLRKSCPAAKPVVVRTAWLPPTTLGECIRRPRRFVVRLNRDMTQDAAIETLCHEWAHALSWSFWLDRLARQLDVDPAEFERASHDEAWGCAYSRVWRAYGEIITATNASRLVG